MSEEKKKISAEDRKKLMDLQQSQQQIQTLLFQKQTVDLESVEIENALKEVEKSGKEDVFQIVGNIMIKKDRDELVKSLKERKELLDIRLKSFEKQINKINEEAQKLQEELFSKR